MDDLPPALSELLVDKDGQSAQHEIQKIISSLSDAGVPCAAIARGLSRVLMNLCEEECNAWGMSRHWARKFLETTGERFTAKYKQVDEEEMALLEKKIRLEEANARLDMYILTECEVSGTA